MPTSPKLPTPAGRAAPTCSEWIPASTPPPMGTWNVIVKGGNYMISEAIYMREPVPMANGSTKPPGFYLSMGGGKIIDAEWVEWWIPMPSLPNNEVSRPAATDSETKQPRPAGRLD